MSGGAKLNVRVAEVVDVNALIKRFRFVNRDGSPMPAFELANHDGRRVTSDDLLAGGPLVLSFFRGSW